MSYLLTCCLIGVIVFVHELGHLLAALWVGIPVARFSLGFGPRLASVRRGGIEYCLSLVPLGGYVLMQIDDEAALLRIPVGRRIAFWLGGPLANLVSAGLLLAVAAAMRDGFSPLGTLVEPWIELVRQTAAFVASLPAIIAHPGHLSGVVGIVAAGKSIVGGGLLATLRFAVLLSLNLAILNLLPIPPLDGGKIFCSLLEKVHPRLARLHIGFTLVGAALLLLLMVYTTVLDVVRQLA